MNGTINAPTMGKRMDKLSQGNWAGMIPAAISAAGSKGALTANSSKGQVFHHCLECRNPGSGGIHSIGVDTHTDQPVRSGLVDRTAQDTEQHHQTDDAAEDD